ncbi:hypothetical protein Dsin_017466 [Dipteronia sinensis]|uniref:HhH-GPD domain-containing protein n=1 Tax=Dipteronia sinensis TaxID=43782 RepID=A0AAE0AF46_9ROSI|nr:hypothetical protein Dsin_017466 [Dipteronia sinensis]
MEETVRDVKESKKKKKRKSSCNFISSDQQQLSSSDKRRKSSTRVISPYFQKEVSKKTDNASDFEEEKTAFYDCKCKLVTEANSSFKSFDDMLSQFAYKGDSIAHLNVRKVGKQRQELLNGCNEEERRKAHLQVRKVSPYFQTATEDTKTKEEISQGKVMGETKNSMAHLQVRTAECKDSKTKQEISQGTRKGESKNSIDHIQARKVSPYFQTATVRKQEQEVLNGCKEEEKISQGRRKGETKNIVALLQVRKVSPYFQTATAGCKDLKTKQEISQGKTKGERKKQKVLNGCKDEEISQGKTKGESKKQKVLNGCKDEEISQGKTKGESKKQNVLKDSKMKVKPPKPCAKSCRKKVKLSPYFKNVAKQEEIADGGIASPEETKKPVRKKKKQKSQVLTAAQKRDKAYLRKTPDNTWIPPPSGLDVPLLQENQVHDPWRVLVICMLLNITSGKQARRVITKLFRLCPDAKTATEVPTEEIEKVIQTLGLQKKRSMMIQRMSQEYLREDWTHVTQLHGIGKYAADAYAIFCTGNWEQVHPKDHKLTNYWDLLKSKGTDKTDIS